jgi:thymidylate kinase
MTRPVTQRRPRTTTRVAVVGIDGAGRTTICRLLQDGGFVDQDLTVVHALRPYETPGAPFGHLSRKLHSLAAAAELLGQPELKAAALYLQLSTYAPVEHFLVEAYQSESLVTAGHPLVDTLAHLPIQRPPAVASVGDWRHLIDPEVLAAVEAWADGIGCPKDLRALGHEVLSLHDLPLDRLLERFRRRFRANLPDVVILLDVDPAEAVRRLGGEGEADSVELAQRLGGREVTEARLAALREQYLRIADWLAASPYGVAVHRIDVTGRSAARVANLVRSKLPRSWDVPITPPQQEAPHLQWAGDLVAGVLA